jgi:UDP-3-O-[3-hydroxymyristoyl] N-acetylglucosamine deacetylase
MSKKFMSNAALSITYSTHRGKILIVDDEASIRRTLDGVFKDEGFETIHAEDGQIALRILSEEKPSLVVLDIWMPGMDGIETLRRIKQLYPDLPVVMISGHATIATAVSATRLGASDFVEKPFDIDRLMMTVCRAISQNSDSCEETKGLDGAGSLDLFAKSENGGIAVGGANLDNVGINPIAFSSQAESSQRMSSQRVPGRCFSQKTLAHSAVLYGQGLHSGKKSGLILEPLPPFSGIHFVGVSELTPVPAYLDYVESTGFATTVRLGTTQAGTIEHLMSALHAYGVSNLLIKCNGEIPVMDGSAKDFCLLFDEVGLEDQKEPWYEIVVDRVLRVGNDKEFIQIEPADEFIIDYTLNYPEPLGKQQFTYTLTDPESYKQEIASTRTFGLVKDIGMLQKQGLALGGRFDNFVLYGKEGAINDKLRFPNEAVRHKILDAIGDLFLLGRKIRGKVTANMTGHSDNIELLKLIKESMQSSSKDTFN